MGSCLGIIFSLDMPGASLETSTKLERRGKGKTLFSIKRRPELSVVGIERKLSDHCPIVLKPSNRNFRAKPFRFFNVWLEEPSQRVGK